MHLINSARYSCIYDAQNFNYVCIYTRPCRLQAERVLHFSASFSLVLVIKAKQKCYLLFSFNLLKQNIIGTTKSCHITELQLILL